MVAKGCESYPQKIWKFLNVEVMIRQIVLKVLKSFEVSVEIFPSYLLKIWGWLF